MLRFFHEILEAISCFSTHEAIFFFFSRFHTGYPRHRENRENDQKKSLSGKTQGIWKCCQNTGKTQGILFGQVVNAG